MRYLAEFRESIAPVIPQIITLLRDSSYFFIAAMGERKESKDAISKV